MKIERHATVIRIGLIYLAVTIGVVAAWILIAPRDFYDDFPTGPSAWASALPPYNEHLLRDFGSAGLGLAVLAGLAAAWMDRRLVQAAAIALFVSFGALVLQSLLPLAILYLASGARQDPAPASAPARTTPKEA